MERLPAGRIAFETLKKETKTQETGRVRNLSEVGWNICSHATTAILTYPVLRWSSTFYARNVSLSLTLSLSPPLSPFLVGGFRFSFCGNIKKKKLNMTKTKKK